ncbi:hypothetical protein ACE1SV_76150 [Streptomyces sennicomposti]
MAGDFLSLLLMAADLHPTVFDLSKSVLHEIELYTTLPEALPAPARSLPARSSARPGARGVLWRGMPAPRPRLYPPGELREH